MERRYLVKALDCRAICLRAFGGIQDILAVGIWGIWGLLAKGTMMLVFLVKGRAFWRWRYFTGHSCWGTWNRDIGKGGFTLGPLLQGCMGKTNREVENIGVFSIGI